MRWTPSILSSSPITLVRFKVSFFKSLCVCVCICLQCVGVYESGTSLGVVMPAFGEMFVIKAATGSGLITPHQSESVFLEVSDFAGWHQGSVPTRRRLQGVNSIHIFRADTLRVYLSTSWPFPDMGWEKISTHETYNTKCLLK